MTMVTSAKRQTQGTEHGDIATIHSEEPVTKKGRWSTAFLMAASALLGATAVAFWNRRTIANMRVQFLAESAKPRPEAHTEEEIF